MIVLEFGYSSSANYGRAVELVKSCPGYSERGAGKEIRHAVPLSNLSANNLLQIYRIVRGWLSFAVYENGRTMGRDPFWNWFWCFETREDQFDKVFYCFAGDEIPHTIGCHRIYELEFRPDAEWLRFGTLAAGGEWTFDKPRIEHFMRFHAQKFRHCPAFVEARIKAFLEVFPGAVNPREAADWIYQESEGKLIGVGPRDREAASYILKGLFALMQLRRPD